MESVLINFHFYYDFSFVFNLSSISLSNCPIFIVSFCCFHLQINVCLMFSCLLLLGFFYFELVSNLNFQFSIYLIWKRLSCIFSLISFLL